MFILIFGLVLFITLEYYNIYTHQDFINTELDRNLNLTLNSSVKDSTIMSGDFESTWDEYMTAYEGCDPQSFLDEMQAELDRRAALAE